MEIIAFIVIFFKVNDKEVLPKLDSVSIIYHIEVIVLIGNPFYSIGELEIVAFLRFV